MSISPVNRSIQEPAIPEGQVIAEYPTYAQAQRSVDFLSDEQFPVRNVTIIGNDLKLVEQVTGRLTYPKAALGGALGGAWFGLFVGLLLSLFSAEAFPATILLGFLIGAGFGILYGIISFALTGGKRDFTSISRVVPSTYSVLVATDHAAEARNVLAKLPNSRVLSPTSGNHPYSGPSGAGQQPSASAEPSSPQPQTSTGTAEAAPVVPAQTVEPPRKDPQYFDDKGQPRYGRRIEQTTSDSPHTGPVDQKPVDQKPEQGSEREQA